MVVGGGLLSPLGGPGLGGCRSLHEKMRCACALTSSIIHHPGPGSPARLFLGGLTGQVVLWTECCIRLLTVGRRMTTCHGHVHASVLGFCLAMHTEGTSGFWQYTPFGTQFAGIPGQTRAKGFQGFVIIIHGFNSVRIQLCAGISVQGGTGVVPTWGLPLIGPRATQVKGQLRSRATTSANQGLRQL